MISECTSFLIYLLNSLLSWQRICLQCRRPQFDSWVGKIPWRRVRLLTPVFLGFPCGSAGKNPLVVWEIWVRSLGLEDSLEKGKATYSRILAWRIPWTVLHGVAKSRTQLSNFHFIRLLIQPLTVFRIKACRYVQKDLIIIKCFVIETLLILLIKLKLYTNFSVVPM